MEYNKKSVRLPKNKKWLALFLTICMIFSMMPMSSMEAYAAAAGNGTEADPYQITTAEDLQTISGSGHYKLMNDIALAESWTPIATFSGTLDGNGKTISGVNVSRTDGQNGFIQELDTDGTVKDLTVYGSVICLNTGNCGQLGTGGIVGYNSGTITGCEFYGTVSQKQGDNMCVAGIAGYNKGAISNCKNYGNITGISTGGSYNAVYVGGITGSNHGSVEISNCINYGTISGSVPNANTNVGEIWGSDSWESNGAYVGGIAGDTNKSGAPGCSNEGIVVGENTNAEAVILTGIIQPPDITIPAPVSSDELLSKLPPSVALTTTGGNRVGTVAWNTGGYDDSKENATYTFSGDVTLPSKVNNDNNIPLITSITVTVGSGGPATPPTEPADYALYFTEGKLYKATLKGGTPVVTGDYTEQTDKWEIAGTTLILKGLAFVTTAEKALIMSDGTMLSLQKETESTLTSAVPSNSSGIFGEGGFTISGDGTVKANGGYAGIITSGLVIESGTIYATGTGKDGIGLYGAASYDKHSGNIKGGKLIASGEMYGIYGYGDDLHIEGGEIWATGNSDNYGALFVFNGTLTSSGDVMILVKGSTQYQVELLQDAVIHSEDVSFGSEMIPCGSVKIGEDFCKTVNIKAVPAHKHCVCGGTEDVGGHTEHYDLAYQPLPSGFTGGTLAAGRYYLTEDITLNSNITIYANVDLCLNGHIINTGSDYRIMINSDSAVFNIADCTRNGSVQGSGSYLIYNASGKTNMFGIAMETTYSYGANVTGGEMNVHGGSVRAKTGGIVANGGVLNLYGGEITALSMRVLAASGAVVNITGGTIDATDSDSVDVKLEKGAALNLGGAPSISKIWFSDPNQISAKCGGQDYTGETILLHTPISEAGDEIVSDVTKDVNDTRFSLDDEAFYLKLDGTNLIAEPYTYSVTLTDGTGYTLEAAGGSSPVNHGGGFTFQFGLKDGYSKTDSFAVKINGEVVSLNANGIYTITDITQDTTVTVEGVADITAPTGEITVGTSTWRQPLNAITFDLFFKDTQSVTVTAEDPGSGVDKIYYYLAEAEMTPEEVKVISDWQEYTGGFNIEPNNKYVIYAKLVDKADNTAYINTEGLVLDRIAPVISGIEDGKTYCEAQSFTVREENLNQVTIKGNAVSAVDGKYTVSPAEEEQTVVVTDKGGNRTEMTITVNDGHMWGGYASNDDATCTADGTMTAKCQFCDATDTVVDEGSMLAHTYGKWTDAKDGKHHIRTCSCGAVETEAHKWDSGKVTKEATTTDKGKKTYTCAVCGTVITKEIPILTDAPRTGDTSHPSLWFILIIAAALGLTGAAAYGKYKKNGHD